MAFDEETTDVLIGGYMSADAAKEDYEAVLQCGARLWGAVVVSKGLDGELSVEESDHMVEEGAAGLASVGFVVGLFATPHDWPRPRSVLPSAPRAADCSTSEPAARSRSPRGRRSRSAVPG